MSRRNKRKGSRMSNDTADQNTTGVDDATVNTNEDAVVTEQATDVTGEVASTDTTEDQTAEPVEEVPAQEQPMVAAEVVAAEVAAPVVAGEVVQVTEETVVVQPVDIAERNHALNISTIKSLLDKYVEIMSKPILNEASLKTGANAFTTAIKRVLTTPNADAFNCLLDFFKQHKDVLMDERYALRGITNIDAQSRAKIETVYTLFRSMTVKKDHRIDLKAAGAVLKCEPIIVFASKKIK